MPGYFPPGEYLSKQVCLNEKANFQGIENITIFRYKEALSKLACRFILSQKSK